MEKLYYDVTNNSIVEDKSEQTRDGVYLIDKDTPNNRFACTKDYLKCKASAFIKKMRDSGVHSACIEMRLEFHSGYDHIRMKEYWFDDPDAPLMRVSSIRTMRLPILQKIKEEIEEENKDCLFLVRRYEYDIYPISRIIEFYIIDLDHVACGNWKPNPYDTSRIGLEKSGWLSLKYSNGTDDERLEFNRRELLSLGKDYLKKAKIDIGSYVVAMKNAITDIKATILDKEKDIEPLRTQLANMEVKYTGLEDYEKLLGEIYEGDNN